MKENEFQSSVISSIEKRLPGCIIMKNDPSYIQGIPDLLILYKDRWASLECKKSVNAPHRPNQDHYVGVMNSMSYSSFIYPENKEVVLDELEQSLSRRSRRSSRVSRSK